MSTAKTPWHIWVVGALTLIWNAGGAFDYVMSKTRNADYLAQMPPAQLEFLNNFPVWLTPFWALAVWGALLGSVLLLARSRFAAPVFMIAFVSMVLVTVHNLFIASPSALETMGTTGLLFSAVIFVVALALVFYARAQVRAGTLR